MLFGLETSWKNHVLSMRCTILKSWITLKTCDIFTFIAELISQLVIFLKLRRYTSSIKNAQNQSFKSCRSTYKNRNTNIHKNIHIVRILLQHLKWIIMYKFPLLVNLCVIIKSLTKKSVTLISLTNIITNTMIMYDPTVLLYFIFIIIITIKNNTILKL